MFSSPDQFPGRRWRRAGQRLKDLLGLACMLAATAACGYFLTVRTQEIRYGLASQDWARTIGTVEESDVYIFRGRWTTLEPRVTYRYSVGGRLLRSESIGNVDYDEAPAVVAAYPLGAKVIVYHDREGTASVLRRGVSRRSYVQFGVALVGFICFAGVSALVLLVPVFVRVRPS